MAQKLAFACGGSLRDAFTHVAVDEAGQATEPEALEAISRLLKPGGKGGHRVVLAGDPKQLGPVLRCALASSAGLGVSLLERLIVHHDGPHRQRTGDSPPSPETEVLLQRFDGFHPAYITMLTDNYRSHLPPGRPQRAVLHVRLPPGGRPACVRGPPGGEHLLHLGGPHGGRPPGQCAAAVPRGRGGGHPGGQQPVLVQPRGGTGGAGTREVGAGPPRKRL